VTAHRTILALLVAAVTAIGIVARAHGQSGVAETSLGDPVVDRQSILGAKVACLRSSGDCRGSLALYRAGNPAEDAGTADFDIPAGDANTLKFDLGGSIDRELRADGKVGFDLHTYVDGQATTVSGERRLAVESTSGSGGGGGGGGGDSGDVRGVRRLAPNEVVVRDRHNRRARIDVRRVHAKYTRRSLRFELTAWRRWRFRGAHVSFAIWTHRPRKSGEAPRFATANGGLTRATFRNGLLEMVPDGHIRVRRLSARTVRFIIPSRKIRRPRSVYWHLLTETCGDRCPFDNVPEGGAVRLKR
jgi:hypothetical protein